MLVLLFLVFLAEAESRLVLSSATNKLVWEATSEVLFGSEEARLILELLAVVGRSRGWN